MVLLFCLPLVHLGAEEMPDLYHIIAYYSFDIKGKSNAELIEKMIVPPGGDPPYASPEAMVKALDAKRNQLNNMRIFEEVSYTYEAIHADSVAIRYRVKFFIDDAFSFIAIPYPKYDSNFGFRLGIKAYDKNLFGSFADLYYVINTTQIDGSWEDYEWYTELEISDIPAGSSRINLNLEAEAIQHGTSLDDLFWTGAIDWVGIPLAQTTFDFHVDIDENKDTQNEFDKWLTASAQWNGLPWFDSSLTVRPSIQFDQKELGDDLNWDVDSVSFFSSVDPIVINGETYEFSNTTKLKFPHDYLRFISSLDLVDATFIGIPVFFWISSDNYFDLTEQAFRDNTYTAGTAMELTLPFRTLYRGSYEFSIREGFDTRLDLVPMLSTTQGFSFGRVNWKQNFRQGMKGSFFGRADYALFTNEFNKLDHLNYVVQAEGEGYLKLGNRIGLSGRALGFFSHVPSFDWYEDQQFPTFLPNDSTSAPEQLRGILNNTYEVALGEGDYQKLGAVLNLDATLLLIKFKGFAEGFMSAFMDVGLFSDTRLENRSNSVGWSDLTLLKTIGIEGYGIMDKFPSYPIRGSLGFNLDDVISHLKGDTGFTEIEYELTIGMGLHY